MVIHRNHRALFLALAVLGLAAVLYFLRLGTRSLWTMEVRWAEIPREMMQSGDFFRPTINGRLYYDKPLGSYWLVLAASELTGRIDELSARLPSALCGLLAVALCMRLAQRLHGNRTALLSGLILATSFSIVDFSRTASADMENVAGELAALLLFLECRRRPTGWWLVPFWLVMALTSLTKGLLGFALPLLILGTCSTLARSSEPSKEADSWFSRVVIRRNRWLFNWKTPLAVAVAGSVYFLPFLLSRDAERGLGMVFRENIQRFFAPVNHRGPVYLYAGAIFALMAPWSALLPAALVQAHRRGEESDDGRRFALVWFWVTFVFFTLSASRRSYYLLPILPAGAVLTARLLTARREALSPLARSLMQIGFGLVALTVLAAGFALVPYETLLPEPWSSLPDLPAQPLFAAGWIVALAVIAYALFRMQPRRIAVALGAVSALAMAYVFLIALPAAEEFRGEKAFAQRVRHTVGADPAGLALFRTRELVYYLDWPNPVNEFESEEALNAAIQRGEVHWLVVRERDLSALPGPYAVEHAAAVFPWEDRTTKTRALLVRFVRRTQAPVALANSGE